MRNRALAISLQVRAHLCADIQIVHRWVVVVGAVVVGAVVVGAVVVGTVVVGVVMAGAVVVGAVVAFCEQPSISTNKDISNLKLMPARNNGYTRG
jgi:hypothetical protein